jgi:GNAT superfamily N-acetyltransferase
MNESKSILHAQTSSNKDLIVAMETNYYAHVSYILERSRGIEVIDNDYLLAISTGFVGRTLFLDDEVKIKYIIDLMKQYYKFLEFSWYITPCSKPENLTTLLNKYGFHLTKTEPGMVFNIKNGNTLKPICEEFSLSLVDSQVSLNHFDQLYAEIWNHQARYHFTNAEDIILQADCPLELYVGYAQGQPVAICELFFGAGIVGIYSVGTVQRSRHKGFASSFLSVLLSNIAQRGYEIITLQSTSTAMNMYKRLGFSELCTFYEYKPYVF